MKITADEEFLEPSSTSGSTVHFSPDSDLVAGGVSSEFIERLLRFVAWAPGWDGSEAENIPVSVAVKALELANRSVPLVGEPFVAPSDGALLLRWHLPVERFVELFVDEDDLEALVLIDEDETRELSVHSPDDVMSRLRETLVKA